MDDLREGKVRFALIGCGAISKKHATAISRLPDAELVGAYDVDKNVAEAFGAEHSVPIFTSVGDMVERADPHIFDIVTPSGMHADTIMELAHYNRHFVVEKPLALRLDQIDGILEECDQRGLKVFVVKQNRFNPPIQKLKEALDKNRFGKLILGSVKVRWCRDKSYYEQKPWRGQWLYDGGVLTNQASHHIDILMWMLGEAESVVARTATRLANIEAEDTGAAIIKFHNGALGIVEATTATRPKDLEGSITVLGEKGSVEIGGFFMNEVKTWSFAEPDDMDSEIWSKYSKVPSVPAWNHTEFFKDVTNSLKSGTKGLIDGLEGRKSIELINAIYESAETGKEVYLRFTPKKCRLGLSNVR